MVCKGFGAVRAGLQASWTPAAFKLKDKTLTSAVHSIVICGAFWEQAAALLQWASDLEALRTWATGCPCHEQECIDSARLHRQFKCPEKKKGCRGPEVKAKLDQTWRYWGERAKSVLKDEWSTEGLAVSISNAYRHSIAEGLLRFGWAYQLPWLIWQCRDPSEALLARQKFQDPFRSGAASSVRAKVKHDGYSPHRFYLCRPEVV